MHRTILGLQTYVRRMGDLTFPPPFVMDKMDMLVFILKVDQAQLQRVVDRELNGPWEQAFALRGLRHSYRAATDWIALVLSEVEELYPKQFQSQRSAANGALDGLEAITARQRELLALVPLDDYGSDPDAGVAIHRASRLWYVPFALNDLPPAIVAGREIFGYPKVLAQFAPDQGEVLLGADEPPWRTLAIRAYGPVERAQAERQRTDAKTGQQRQLTKYKLDLTDVIRVRFDPKDAAPLPSASALFSQRAGEYFEQRIELLFLRQYLDPQFDNRASYQAVVSGSITPGAGDDAITLPPALDRPQCYRLELPLLPGSHTVLDDLGVELDAEQSAVPKAVFKLSDQRLVVTRGEIRWDKP